MFKTCLFLALLPGCFHKPLHPTVEEAPCQGQADAIEEATFGASARVAVRAYLACIVDQETKLTDLEDRVSHALRRNPYPATGRIDVLGHFFDTDRMKLLPGAPIELPAAIEMLEDQALARTAMGDLDMAQAARARAARLAAVARVLEDISD